MSHKSAKRMRRATLDLEECSDGKLLTMRKLEAAKAFIRGYPLYGRKGVSWIVGVDLASGPDQTVYVVPPEAQQARKSV